MASAACLPQKFAEKSLDASSNFVREALFLISFSPDAHFLFIALWFSFHVFACDADYGMKTCKHWHRLTTLLLIPMISPAAVRVTQLSLRRRHKIKECGVYKLPVIYSTVTRLLQSGPCSTVLLSWWRHAKQNLCLQLAPGGSTAATSIFSQWRHNMSSSYWSGSFFKARVNKNYLCFASLWQSVNNHFSWTKESKELLFTRILLIESWKFCPILFFYYCMLVVS